MSPCGGTFAGVVDSPAPAPPDSAPPGDLVTLTDLEVITRYSLALRTASAERAELIRVLRDDLDWLTAAGQVEQVASPTPPERAARRRSTTTRSRRP